MRFRAVFEQAPVSIQILAPDGRTLRVNQAWEDLWQIREGSAVKAHVLSAAYNVLEDPQLVGHGIAATLRRAFAGESVALPAIRYDVATLDGTGPARWVTARAHPVKDADGRVVEVMLIHEDITERLAAEQALHDQDRRKDEFLAMLAHELRNPLAPISAAADLLRTVGSADERVRKASDVIARQVRHMTTLVDDLLDVSRVTRGLIQLDRAMVDLGSIVANAVEQARPLMQARGHAFAIEGGAGTLCVHGDANRLVQVVVNLLNNAAKYTPRGGRIALACVREGTTVAISVRDNGIGLDNALLPHVFDLFTQAERSPDRAQGGLGIGLALVRNIVAMHGGQVTAYSDGPGRGSVFTVTLDLMAA
ncbi:PAS domain-containing sensor histidine kinase [Pseudoduganella umbonata]|nr:PAS domain-containing sensor histidine kinase [Pseudoduganella umbonata]MBB3221146.1 signal transduction histidine kinase [Pseudoduganella umbonata]